MSGSAAERFEAFYDRHSVRVFGIALRICGDVQLAENICVSVFVKLWRLEAQVDEEFALEWMRSEACRQALGARGRSLAKECITDMLTRRRA